MIKLIAWMIRKFVAEESDNEKLYPILTAIDSRLPYTETLMVKVMFSQEDMEDMIDQEHVTGEYQHVPMLA